MRVDPPRMFRGMGEVHCRMDGVAPLIDNTRYFSFLCGYLRILASNGEQLDGL